MTTPIMVGREQLVWVFRGPKAGSLQPMPPRDAAQAELEGWAQIVWNKAGATFSPVVKGPHAAADAYDWSRSNGHQRPDSGLSDARAPGAESEIAERPEAKKRGRPPGSKTTRSAEQAA